MRGVQVLVELARRATDEHQRNLARVSREKADARLALIRHEKRTIDESRVATTDSAMIGTVSEWSSHAAKTRTLLRTRQAELDRTEAAVRDALRSAFGDLKRLETARDTAIRQEKIAASRRADGEAEERYAAARFFAVL